MSVPNVKRRAECYAIYSLSVEVRGSKYHGMHDHSLRPRRVFVALIPSPLPICFLQTWGQKDGFLDKVNMVVAH